MSKALEQKFENIIKELKSQQFDGTLPGVLKQSKFNPEKLIKVSIELKNSASDINRQNNEISFAYQTLELAYQRYWEFFNFAPDGYLVTDTSGNIKEANQTFLSMLGEAQSCLLDKSISDFIPEIKQSDIGMQLNWFSGSQNLEVYLQPANHPPFYASFSIAPQCNARNETIGLLWSVRDTTEHKKMEEELRKASLYSRSLIEASLDPLVTISPEGKIMDVNKATERATGYPREHLIDSDFSNYFTEPEKARTAYQRAHAEGQIKDFPLTLRHVSGQTMDVIYHASVYYDETGEIRGVFAAARDITERIEAERFLRKSERFSSSLLNNSPAPIAVINTDSSIAYVNPALEKLTGFSAEQIIGQKAPYPWMRKESFKSVDAFLQFLKKGKRESYLQKKNGDWFWAEVNTTLIENDDEPQYYLQTWVDITEAKLLRENLEFYVMQITRAQEEERKRIAQELHEETIQSLAALGLSTESIIKTEKLNPAETDRNLRQLLKNINEVIEEVRQFSYDLRPGVLDYLGLTAALETLTEKLKGKDIKSQFIVSGKERPLTPDMEITLFRIAQEVINNSIKYSRAESVNIALKYYTARVKLKIEDNGQGFKLPDRMSELANQGKLGLIGIEERTRLYGGSFSIESRPQKGTMVTVTLPISLKSGKSKKIKPF